MITFKRCYRCKQEKRAEEFSHDRRQKDGRRKDCKSCGKIYGAKYRATHPLDNTTKQQRASYGKKYRNQNKEKLRQRAKVWRDKNKDVIARKKKEYINKPGKREQKRAADLKRNYNLSIEAFSIMRESQQGKCKICGHDPILSLRWKFLVVDHDHKTGKVRGLLCNICNRVLGLMKDNVLMLRKAADYLDASNGNF